MSEHPSAVRAAPRAAAFAFAALVALTLGACGDSEDAKEARTALRITYDTMLGPPSAKALAERTRFSAAGIAFDYPSPLRSTYEVVDGDDVWSLRYGLYELEVWASTEALDAHGYLDAIGGALVAAGGARIVEPVSEGRTLTVCGEQVITSKMRMDVDELDSRQEAFVVPSSGSGGDRIIMFTDMRMDKGESPVADAVAKMVLATLNCTGGHAAEEPAP